MLRPGREGRSITREQKIVAVGGISGVLTMAASVWLLSRALPGAEGGDAVAVRMGYALQWNAVAALPLVMTVVAIANARFGSEAIDPTKDFESKAMIVDGRVADKSTRQLLLFVIPSLAVAVGVSADGITL